MQKADDQQKKQLEDQRVKLDLLHCFGSLCSNNYRNGIGIIEEDGYNLLFPIGKYMAIKQSDKSDMAFMRLNENLEKVMSIAISPNNKYVAICERRKNDDQQVRICPQVSVYNIKSYTVKANLNNEKKQFQYPDTSTESFISMAFSYDSRFLVCLTESPEFKLVFIDLLANKKDIAGAVLKLPINKVTISPQDNHMVGISGNNTFKILRVQEGSFAYVCENVKRLPTNNTVFTDHIWMDEGKIALSNDKGEIFLIYENEVKQYIQNAFDVPSLSINCMVPLQKGLIVASDTGLFSFWLKNESHQHEEVYDSDDFQYTYIRCWSSERGIGASCLCVTKNEDLLAVGFLSNDIATFDLTKLIPQVPESVQSLKQNQSYMERKLKFDYIFNGFHSGPITCMDVCLQRPLIVTCSQKDSTIRIWNYVNFKCELARKFITDNKEKSPLLSVAFHPSGYYLAAGFIDKFRLFHILKDELKPYKEQPVKNASLLRFSSGGQYLAVAFPKTKNQSNQYCINIYNAYSLQLIVSLNGPPNQVTEIVWGPYDEFIIGCCQDGTVYRWVPAFTCFHGNTNLSMSRSEKKLTDKSNQKFKYTSLLYNTQTNLIWVAGGNDDSKGIVYGFGDQVEQEMRDKFNLQHGNQNYSHQIQDLDYELKNYRITQFCFLQSFYNYYGIIAGTNSGAIKVFGHHFSTIPYETIQAHCGQVMQIRASPDGRYIFSAGEDGAIFIFQVSEITKEGLVLSNRSGDFKPEESIITDNPKAFVVDEHLADVIMMQRNEIENYIQENEKIQNQYKEFQIRMQDTIREEKFRLEYKMQKMKDNYEDELKRERRKYEELLYNKQTMEQDYKIMITQIEEKNLKTVEELENLYERKLAFENDKYIQMEIELKEERVKFDRKMLELMQKHDNNINLLKNEFNQNFSKAQKVYDTMKYTAEEVKKIYEEKISQQEEEHQIETNQIIDNNSKEVQSLNEKTQDLLSKNKKLVKQFDEQTEKNAQLLKTLEEKDLDLSNFKQKVKDLQQMQETLKNEYKQLEDIIKKKEKKIQDQKFTISDLQKSKHVLQFRTTEMRQSLEPKEIEIQQLKSQLFKIETEFQEMMQIQQRSTEEMKKMQTTIDILKKNLKQQTETTRTKDSLIEKITMDIYNCVQEKDIKEWPNEMQKLYQVYVKNQEIKDAGVNEKGIQEMQKQINYLEKSILQMDKSSSKQTQKRELEIYKKTKENAELIHEINEMRKNNKRYQDEISGLKARLQNNEIEKTNKEKELKRLKNQINKKNKDSLNNSAEKKGPLQFDTSSLDNSLYNNNISKSLNNQSSLPLIRRNEPQNIFSYPKGKLIKGFNFDAKAQQAFEKAKMMDIISEMEDQSRKIAYQAKFIQKLKVKIRQHVISFSCDDPNFDDFKDETTQIQKSQLD